MHILTGQLIWEKHILSETLGGRGCSIPLAWEDLASNLWNQKGSLDFLSKFLCVFHPWNGSEFRPPARHVQLVGPLIQPGFNILYRGLQKVVAPAPCIWVGQRPPWGMCIFLPLGVLRVWLYLRFPKGYPPLLLRPTRGPQLSIQRTTLQVTPTATMGVGSLYISHPPAQSFNVTEHLSSL